MDSYKRNCTTAFYIKSAVIIIWLAMLTGIAGCVVRYVSKSW